MIELKSLDRINRNIDSGMIKKIYIYDKWLNSEYIKKIFKLVGEKVDLCIINPHNYNTILFKETDCLLITELNIMYGDNRLNYLLQLARDCGAFRKVITEDIFCVEL